MPPIAPTLTPAIAMATTVPMINCLMLLGMPPSPLAAMGSDWGHRELYAVTGITEMWNQGRATKAADRAKRQGQSMNTTVANLGAQSGKPAAKSFKEKG